MIRKFYDREYIGGGEYIDTCNPDYDPNKKGRTRRFIINILKTIGYGFFAFFCIGMIVIVGDKATSDMEVGIGIVGIAGLVFTIQFIVCIARLCDKNMRTENWSQYND